jgi:phospholipase C
MVPAWSSRSRRRRFASACYDHATLPDLLGAQSPNLTWGYYINFPINAAANLWTAPNAINHICGPNSGHSACTANAWNNVAIPPSPAQQDKMAPILEDIENCALKNVSWVIPDQIWSDHGGPFVQGTPGNILGPAWVAAIVNAVGNNAQCPTGTPDAGETFWNNTVIIVTWDDWGGFYDHVLPLNCSSSGVCSGYSNSSGKQFVYGFRVPMLVISAYNNHATNGQQGFKGYISGACGQT